MTTEFEVGKHGIGYVSSGFEEFFKGEKFDAVTFAPRSITLPRGMTDAEIERELKPGLCTIGDVVAVLDSGEEKYKDGYWNLFYFRACVVSVYWGAGNGCWNVYAWKRVGNGWRAGYRVFSPATDGKRSDADTFDLSTLTLESLDARLRKIEHLFNPELLK